MPRCIRSILTLLVFTFQLSAQSWEALQSLKPGDRIQVQDAEGKHHRGVFVSASPDVVTLQTSQGKLAIDRPRVKKIEIRSNQVRARNILIGAAIGVAVGVALDQSLGTYTRNETGEASGTRAITYIAPAAVFAALRSFPAYRTIYRKP